MAMTSAYAHLPTMGRLHGATFIRRVEDADGKVLFVAKSASEQVLSPRTAFLMTSMLSDVVNYGTAL
jgi:membrane peptidoglycan carboxypeptidase